MKEKIQQAFVGCIQNNCLIEEQVSYFEIFDPASEDNTSQEKCHIVFEPGKGHFQVENTLEKSIRFLAIDSCLFVDANHRKCDFALFDDKSFCFADIKNAKTSQRSAARKSAREQLYVTIGLFKEKIDFSGFQVLAIVALTFKHSYPLAKVDSQDAKIRFEDEYNVALFEGNRMAF